MKHNKIHSFAKTGLLIGGLLAGSIGIMYIFAKISRTTTHHCSCAHNHKHCH